MREAVYRRRREHWRWKFVHAFQSVRAVVERGVFYSMLDRVIDRFGERLEFLRTFFDDSYEDKRPNAGELLEWARESVKYQVTLEGSYGRQKVLVEEKRAVSVFSTPYLLRKEEALKISHIVGIAVKQVREHGYITPSPVFTVLGEKVTNEFLLDNPFGCTVMGYLPYSVVAAKVYYPYDKRFMRELETTKTRLIEASNDARDDTRDRVQRFLRSMSNPFSRASGGIYYLFPSAQIDLHRALRVLAAERRRLFFVLLPVLRGNATMVHDLHKASDGKTIAFADNFDGVVLDLPVSEYEAIVFERNYRGYGVTEELRIGGLYLFRFEYGKEVSPNVIRISDKTRTCYLDGELYTEYYLEALQIIGDGKTFEELAADLVSRDNLTAEDAMMVIAVVSTRAFEHMVLASEIVSLHLPLSFRGVLKRYVWCLYKAGCTVYQVMELAYRVASPGFSLLSELRKRFFAEVKRALFAYFESFMSIEAVYSVEGEASGGFTSDLTPAPLVFLEETRSDVRCRLTPAAAMLLEKFETVAGKTRHMREIDRKWVIKTHVIRRQETSYRRAASDPVALSTMINQTLDADYQATYPNRHLELRHMMGSYDLGYDTIEMKVRMGPNEWVHKPVRVHKSKIGGGEMVRKAAGMTPFDALGSRNLGVIHQGPILDWDDYVAKNMEFYGDSVWVSDWRSVCIGYKNNPVDVDPRSMELMSKTMTSAKYAKYMNAQLTTLENTRADELLVILKNRVKETPVYRKMLVPQTVFFLGPDDALYWLLFCKELVVRKSQLRRPECFTGDGKSYEDIEDHLNTYVKASDWGKVRAYMTDQSQFDKSQNASATAIERGVMREVGVSERHMDIWFGMNYRVRARFIGVAIKLVVAEMRRSGHPLTLDGNTTVTDFTQVVTRRITREHVKLRWTQGDDDFFLPQTVQGLNTLASYEIAYAFNLIEKLERFAFAWYNCSLFILPLRGQLVLVYDPVKLFAKFSRPNTLGEYATYDERIKNYRSLTKHYDEVEVVANMCIANEEMRGYSHTLTQQLMIACLTNVNASRDQLVETTSVLV